MAEKVKFVLVQCPSCGASLKAANANDPIACVYCGNTVMPVQEPASAPRSELSGGMGGVLRIEGMRTPASGLAYMEQFFEEYDWESFAYAQALSIPEIDKLVASMKLTSADDKNTYLAAFQATFVPYAHKIAGCKDILEAVIREYKEDNLDAYSTFDAYKRVSSMIAQRKEDILAALEKSANNAEKYKASAEEVAALRANLESLRNSEPLQEYPDIKDIPEIRAFTAQKNAAILEQLAAKGIDANAEYQKARQLCADKHYSEALNALLPLQGYSDTADLIEKIDKYFLITDVVEICGKLYFFKRSEEDSNILNLHPTEGGKIQGKPLIKNISQILTNFADNLYYLDDSRRLRVCNLTTGEGKLLYDKSIVKYFFRNRKGYLEAKQHNSDYETSAHDLLELNLAAGNLVYLVKNIRSVSSFTGNKLVYTISEKDVGTVTKILNVDTRTLTSLGTRVVKIEGYLNNHVIYTQKAPNDSNKNLFAKPLESDAPEILIERNIFNFETIVAGKLFYYIGNSRNQNLITNTVSGTERTQWPLYVSEILFEQGNWLYFIRRVGYNSVLCKSRLDGTRLCVIAANIEKFVKVKNGYLYYINDESALVKVRLDGSNLQTLCQDVEDVLAVKEDKIIFVSIDDKIHRTNLDQSISTFLVKSIYAVEFSGSGKIKLAYNITQAKTYNDDTVYFIAKQQVTSSDRAASNQNLLYRLKVEDNRTAPLLTIEELPVEKTMSTFAVCMIIMLICLVMIMFGAAIGVVGFSVIGLIGGIISLIVGVISKINNP